MFHLHAENFVWNSQKLSQVTIFSPAENNSHTSILCEIIAITAITVKPPLSALCESDYLALQNDRRSAKTVLHTQRDWQERQNIVHFCSNWSKEALLHSIFFLRGVHLVVCRIMVRVLSSLSCPPFHHGWIRPEGSEACCGVLTAFYVCDCLRQTHDSGREWTWECKNHSDRQIKYSDSEASGLVLFSFLCLRRQTWEIKTSLIFLYCGSVYAPLAIKSSYTKGAKQV